MVSATAICNERLRHAQGKVGWKADGDVRHVRLVEVGCESIVDEVRGVRPRG